MLPGLQSDEYAVVNKMAYLFSPPQRGDVIVFHYPKDQSQDFIKRIIGLPGDVVQIDATHIWVNHVLLQEPYISAAINPADPTMQTLTIPPNQYFVLGDNRPTSDDSRYWGEVPKDLIVGKAILVYWPLSNWQIVDTHSTVYAKIKASK